MATPSLWNTSRSALAELPSPSAWCLRVPLTAEHAPLVRLRVLSTRHTSPEQATQLASAPTKRSAAPRHAVAASAACDTRLLLGWNKMPGYHVVHATLPLESGGIFGRVAVQDARIIDL
jgi:hypothetical protein